MTQRYDVAAYVWPSYHPDPRAKIFWPMGIGEWETVMKAAPRFEGHEQPRRPLWGYVNEADPDVMAMQVDAAADHGVNVFIYDWYWYDGMPFLESCLNDGFLKAPNRDRMKFYLMWANHDVNLCWDRRNADDAFTGANGSLIWRGGLGRSEFEGIAKRWIERYFSQPNYYRIEGRPVFMLYDLVNFIKGLGGLDGARSALDWFRDEVVKAGFPGLELQLSMRRDSPKSLSAVPGDNLGTQKGVVEDLGFDSLTHYQFCHFTDVDRDYDLAARDAEAEWHRISETYPAKYHPHVSVGWDSSPRALHFRGSIIRKNTPAAFEAALRRAKAFVDGHPDRAPLVTVNSWNEWTETSYLEPCALHGYGYLEAVKRVFL